MLTGGLWLRRSVALSANISETSINPTITVGREVKLDDEQIGYGSWERELDPAFWG